MKPNTYYLFDGDKKISFSYSFEKLLNKTTKTKDAKIFFNGKLIWVQNPEKHIKD